LVADVESDKAISFSRTNVFWGSRIAVMLLGGAKPSSSSVRLPSVINPVG
jgi:hypothetical protein